MLGPGSWRRPYGLFPERHKSLPIRLVSSPTYQTVPESIHVSQSDRLTGVVRAASTGRAPGVNYPEVWDGRKFAGRNRGLDQEHERQGGYEKAGAIWGRSFGRVGSR